MIDIKIKAEIDNMSYETMLTKLRFAPMGDKLFQGQVGEYFMELMKTRRDSISSSEHTQISKRITWDR